MLFAAMIEARSCERFKILSENLNDQDLKKFYKELMESEARHYTTFLKYARKYSTTIDVKKKWKEFLSFEAELMKSTNKWNNTWITTNTQLSNDLFDMQIDTEADPNSAFSSSETKDLGKVLVDELLKKWH